MSRCEHNETMAVVVEADDPSYQEFEAWRLAGVEAGAGPGLGGARPGDTEGRGRGNMFAIPRRLRPARHRTLDGGSRQVYVRYSLRKILENCLLYCFFLKIRTRAF